MSYNFKDEPLPNIFATGTTATLTGYKINDVVIGFLPKFANLPDQTIGFFSTTLTQDVGKIACPKYTRYLADGTHTCNSKATGVYLILVGGGGGGGSGGSNEFFSGDGGGGGGGGGMFAGKISISNNPTILIPITITITKGQGGNGGGRRTNDGYGTHGDYGTNTQAIIACSGTNISVRGNGGGFGLGGEYSNNGIVDDTGGYGGYFLPWIQSSSGYSTAGEEGGDGDDGTGSNGDISYGGNGGLNGYSVKSFFGIETPFTYGNGGIGGAGDSDATSYVQNGITYVAFNNGSPGQPGKDGVAYVFEYFD